MFNELRKRGWDIFSNQYAEQLLFDRYRDFSKTFEKILSEHEITKEEIIGGGGGLHIQTKRLRDRFDEVNLKKANLISMQRTINSLTEEVIADTVYGAGHEIDHMLVSATGNIAIEIEWNTKPTSFDRDLDSFKRFFNSSAIDLGMIITRGEKLNSRLSKIIYNFFEPRITDRYLEDAEVIKKELAEIGLKYDKPTNPQIGRIEEFISRGSSPAEALSKVFHVDKYASSTTHWKTLMERFNRGGYKSVPLLFLGIPSSCIKS